MMRHRWPYLVLLLVPVLLLGVYFSPIVAWAKHAVTMFGM
jgi:hypothetical protein